MPDAPLGGWLWATQVGSGLVVPVAGDQAGAMTNSNTEPTSFHDRVVLITGGTSGMGLATARLLLHRGAHSLDICADRVPRRRLSSSACSSQGPRWVSLRSIRSHAIASALP